MKQKNIKNGLIQLTNGLIQFKTGAEHLNLC
jgi:hypothetical protein